MFTKRFEKFADEMIRKGQCDAENRELIVYGLSVGIELIFNVLTTILIGYCFGLVFESLIFLIAFPFLRTYAGGFHCENAINCYIFSISLIFIVLILVKFTPYDYIFNISLIILILSIPIILKLAPIESNHRKLDEDENNYFRKKTITNLIIEFVIICFLAILNLYTYVFLISLGVFLTSIMLVLQIIVAKKQQN